MATSSGSHRTLPGLPGAPTATVSSFEMVDGHPMYRVSVSSSSSNKGKGSHSRQFLFRFNAYRDLHSSLSSELRREMEATAPFPKTFKRARLGIKLTKSMLESRRKDLSHWLATLVSRFPSMSPSDRAKVSAFLHHDHHDKPTATATSGGSGGGGGG
eukprot:CAMPEP_0119542264 /NCGR_PEP_ID=MMETSP1344-20130328/53479_1 /TAXON_ID=236787 /ORGANISM="Florenciella parvula, Strain CCMP2471" /LENGTH=156 /DNA_ID=CAMNT_0007586449 /DNA_START=139 /DNA_END=606 /DNA_ORIENTATION=-